MSPVLLPCRKNSYSTYEKNPTKNSGKFRFALLPLICKMLRVYWHALKKARLSRNNLEKEGIVGTHRLTEEIREINLAYLLLAQQMVREDKVSAVYRLGISHEMADLLDALTPGQITKMAGSNMLLCRFRFDDRLILEMLTSYTKDRAMHESHAAILLAGRPAQGIAA